MMMFALSCLVATLLSYPRVTNGFSLAPSRHNGLYNTQHASASALNMAVWSDTKAVRDYQEFLQSGKQTVELKEDGPCVIIRPLEGSTELADALQEMGMGDDVVLTPDQELPDTVGRDGEAAEYPIYITIPPSQLQAFLANLPASYQSRTDDFVFFSGGLEYGNVEDVLKDKGYCRDSMTQVLISGMKVTKMNRVIDLSVKLGADTMGMDKWAGECAACGKWNGAIAKRLERSTIRCRTDFYREWRRQMWERNAYDAIFHLLGVVREDKTTLSDVANYYNEEASDIVWEVSSHLRGWKALTLMYGFEERLFGIAESAGADQTSTLLDEMFPFIWGQSVFLQSETFAEYLQYAQEEKGFLPTVDLPKKSLDEFKSNMRKGNLRADGVI